MAMIIRPMPNTVLADGEKSKAAAQPAPEAERLSAVCESSAAPSSTRVNRSRPLPSSAAFGCFKTAYQGFFC